MNLRQLSTLMKKLSSTNRHAIAIATLLLIAVVTHWRWFYEPNSVLTYGDWWYYSQESLSELFRLPLVLTSDNFGGVNQGISMYPIILAFGALSRFVSFGLIERIVYLWPSIIISSLGGYYLGWKITKSYSSSFILSVVFTYNTYLLLARTGHLTLATSFALAPVIIGLLFKLLEEPKIKVTLLFSLAYCVAGIYEIRALYLTTFVVVFLTIVKLASSRSIKYILVRAAHLALSVFIVSMFNLYWIISLSSLGYLGSGNPLFQRGLFGSYFMSVYRSLTLFHPFWSGGPLEPFIIQGTPIYFFLIPVLALLPLAKSSAQRINYILFGVVACLGIFLTKMSNPPFESVYGWLYLNFPGFNAFRESSKFYFYVALGYSVLIAINFYSFSRWIEKCKNGFLIKTVVFVLVAFVFLFNTKFLINGSVGTIFIPQKSPEEYVQLNKLLKSEFGMYRTLVIPSNSRWVSTTQKKQYVGYLDLLEFAGHYIPDIDTEEASLGRSVELNLGNPHLLNFMSKWSIKYVVVPINHAGSGEDFFSKDGKERITIMSTLKQNDHFRQTIITNKKGEELGLFELINPAPVETQGISDTYGIFDKDQLTLSTRYSRNWSIKSNGAEILGKEDPFGRVRFDGVEDRTKISPVFAPQKTLDKYFRLSMGIFVLVLVMFIAISLKDICASIYRKYWEQIYI